jgi:hypothetical protein
LPGLTKTYPVEGIGKGRVEVFDSLKHKTPVENIIKRQTTRRQSICKTTKIS